MNYRYFRYLLRKSCNSVLFSLKAPKGHLPWGGWGDPGKFKRWRLGYLFARFD